MAQRTLATFVYQPVGFFPRVEARDLGTDRFFRRAPIITISRCRDNRPAAKRWSRECARPRLARGAAATDSR